MENEQLLLHQKAAEKYLSQLTSAQQRDFMTYYNLLDERNSHINLTAITGIDDVYLKHFADSLIALPLIPDNSKILDIGCGAGFPSIPLKIANPTYRFTLLDSVNKKVSFVNEVIARLNLQDITAVHQRIEDHKTYDYDFCVARAVSGLNTLIEYAVPFLKINGCLLAYKSQKAAEEIQTAEKIIKLLGCRIAEIYSFKNPDTGVCDKQGVNLERNIIIIQKIAHTPKGYPRPKNLPRTKPIV